MLIIFGYAIHLETQNIPLDIQDFDRSPLSRSYVEQLFATNQFQPISGARDRKAIALIDQADFSRYLFGRKIWQALTTLEA